MTKEQIINDLKIRRNSIEKQLNELRFQYTDYDYDLSCELQTRIDELNKVMIMILGGNE